MMNSHLDAHGNFAPGTFGHPRPQLERDWICLNGNWDFAKDAQASWTKPSQVKWNAECVVPYAPETPASGINDTGFYKACWYRRTFERPRLKRGERLILHFGAVDYRASVWVNGDHACDHEGGYTPFSADITDYLAGNSSQTIVVRAFDDSQDMSQPRGKQDWLLDAHGIWYPRTTGIWQTVWLEVIPATHIQNLRWSSNVENWCIALDATIGGATADEHTLSVTMTAGEKVLSSDSYSVSGGKVVRTISLPDPGIDDARNRLQWHPDHPTLIDVQLELRNSRGQVVDSPTSYTAMRAVWTHNERFMLNSATCFLRMALDQGYWTETGLTAPDDEAIKRDVELAKQMGLNAVRKHQKIEDPRFLYWADKLGLMVWTEMPSPYAFTPKAIERVTRQWLEVLERDVSHPCVIAWVPFNESWGLPDLPRSAAQRDFVRGMIGLTKAFDATRPVIGNSGWEAVGGDVITIHDYDSNPQSFAERYADSEQARQHLFAHQRPGGRVLLLDDASIDGKALLVDEMGGVRYAPGETEGKSWGYSDARTPEELLQKYADLIEPLRRNKRISGFCWTQFTDTYQEANGLLFMDRKPKVDIEKLAQINRG